MTSEDRRRKTRDPDFIGAESAMYRAARRARQRAENNAEASETIADDIRLSRDPQTLSFSQAHGHEDLPGPLKLEELPHEARTQIWNVLYSHLARSGRIRSGLPAKDDISGNWERILKNMHCSFDKRALDDWNPDFRTNQTKLRQRVEQDPFNKVLDRLLFIMRDQNCPREFIRDLNRVFEHCRLAYTIDLGPPPTILPATTPDEGKALVKSLHVLRQAGLSHSMSHLQKASDCINRRDWPGSVRESIHAVESVARTIDPKQSLTLTRALKTIEEKQGGLHPDLKEALVKLYRYASDLKDSRHGQPEGKNTRAGMDEAVLMLGTCASFASYLWRKHVSGVARE